MKIRIWTEWPVTLLLPQVQKNLESAGHPEERLEKKESQDGVVVYDNLSEIQFVALEDAAVRLGLAYDGGQE